MRRMVLVILSLVILTTSVALAQSTPTTPMVPEATPTPAPTEDARLAVCSAPTLPGFVPHMVRPGEHLETLLVGVTNVTITQVAALNCLDDPNWLPVGSVIWLPENLMGIEVAFPVGDTDPTVDNAVISSFRANAEVVTNEEGVTFTWAAEGSEAYLYPCPTEPHAGCPRPFNAMQVPLAHTVTIRGFQYAERITYRLEVVDGDAAVTQDVIVRIVCATEWLAPVVGAERCAQIPAQPVYAAWEPFEGGIMLWFADTRQIYVLFNEGRRVQTFADPYTNQPDPTMTPPLFRNVPVRGFGQIWLQLGGPDGSLGWAREPEFGFDSARQPAGSQSYTTYIQGPGQTVYAITLVPGTNAGYWQQVAG